MATVMGSNIDPSRPITFLYLWPLINCSTLSVAYGLNKPQFILGKQSDGSINPVLLFINFPWLAITWTIFHLQIKLSSEDFMNQIGDSNYWISNRPFKNDDLSQFDLIIDLTCEFVKYKTTCEYLCLPNLDGMPLTNFNIDQNLETKKILIHCANGHGRSSIFLTNILLNEKQINTPIEGLNLIKNSRNKATPNSNQQKWLISQSKTDLS